MTVYSYHEDYTNVAVGQTYTDWSSRWQDTIPGGVMIYVGDYIRYRWGQTKVSMYL